MFGLFTNVQKAALDAAMTGMVATIRAAIARNRILIQLSDWRLLALVAGVWGIALGSREETRNAMLSYLRTIDTILARLDGPSRAEVLAETLPIDKWRKAAQVLIDDLATQIKTLGDEAVASQVKAQFDAFVEQAKKAAKTGQEWLPWIVGGVAVVGVISLLSQISTTVAVAHAVNRGSRRR